MQRRLAGPNAVRGLEGSRVGRYVLQDCLGHGSHTAVYRALTPAGDWCALKLVDVRLQGGEDLAERLRRDSAVLDQVGHPRILPVLNPMRSDEMTAAAMPLLDGPSLRDLMVRGGLDSELAWTILGQVADSLQAVHRRGLVYKVLKPGNILVKEGRAFLAEFGIAGRGAGQVGLTTTDCRLSAAQYLAPEQILGAEPDHRADVYAFAVLVFELATGTPLYGADTQPFAILRRTLGDPPPSAHARNPLVPADVDGVLRRALARDPDERHGSACGLLEELACPPRQDHAREVVRPEPAGGEVTVDSLIDVLSAVLDAERGGDASRS